MVPWAKRGFILLWGGDGTNLANIYAWWRIAMLEQHPLHLPDQFIDSTLKVIRKHNYETVTVCSFNFHKIFLNINKTCQTLIYIQRCLWLQKTQKQSSRLLDAVKRLQGKLRCLTQISGACVSITFLDQNQESSKTMKGFLEI